MLLKKHSRDIWNFCGISNFLLILPGCLAELRLENTALPHAHTTAPGLRCNTAIRKSNLRGEKHLQGVSKHCSPHTLAVTTQKDSCACLDYLTMPSRLSKDQAGLYNGNTSDLYSGGSRLQSRSR
jgi:hypothetical protein